jgi:hypothetical protein
MPWPLLVAGHKPVTVAATENLVFVLKTGFDGRAVTHWTRVK